MWDLSGFGLVKMDASISMILMPAPFLAVSSFAQVDCAVQFNGASQMTGMPNLFE